MFGVQITSMDMTYKADLVNGPKIFELVMQIFTISNGVFMPPEVFPLEACTK